MAFHVTCAQLAGLDMKEVKAAPQQPQQTDEQDGTSANGNAAALPQSVRVHRNIAIWQRS